MFVHLKQLGVTYEDGTPALMDISLSVERGEQLALIGPSGSGKSTLLRALSMALAPTVGAVLVDSLDPWQQKMARLQTMRSRIHLCPQGAPFPARQRVVLAVLSGLLPTRSLLFALRSLLSPTKSDVALVYACLQQLGVEAHLWRPVDTLSGGQRQRVAIARAMLAESEMLFVDEPLSALDPSNSERCLSALLEHAESTNQAIVCSLHQVDLARRYLTRIIGLRQGQVHFDCAASDVSNDMIDALYRGHESEIQG